MARPGDTVPASAPDDESGDGGLSPELHELTRCLEPLVALAASVMVLPVLFGGVGLLVALISDFGRRIHPAYYTVFAQVLPLLLIAAVVEDALNLEKLSSERRRRAARWFLVMGAQFLFAESCVLYAVAADVTTTFLFVVPLIAGLVLVVEIVGGVLTRFEIVALPDRPDLSERLEKSTKRRVQQLRAQGKDAEADALESRILGSNGERHEP